MNRTRNARKNRWKDDIFNQEDRSFCGKFVRFCNLAQTLILMDTGKVKRVMNGSVTSEVMNKILRNRGMNKHINLKDLYLWKTRI